MTDKDNSDNVILMPLTIEEQVYLLQSIMESSTEYSIYACNLHGNIIAWNAGAKLLYGYNNEEIMGQQADILHHPDNIKSGKTKAIIEKVLQTGKWSGALRRLRKDGNTFNVFVTITLRKDFEGHPIGFTYISRDITDLENVLDLINKLKISEAKLKDKNMELAEKSHAIQESDRLKNEFLANASHELRTPLNGIIGFAELLYDSVITPDSPQYKEFLNDILLSAKHLLTLINELLDLAKIEAGKIEFHPVKINLLKLLEDIKELFHPLMSEKNIQLDTSVDTVLEYIIIDPDRLRQIIINFISNAIKFSHDDGRITLNVCLLKDKKNFCLSVKDSGIGIKADDIDKLFIKFHQLNASPNKQYQGSGLGLALVKQLVEAQGGHVDVESVYGHGSTFYAILPCFPYRNSAQKQEEIAAVDNQSVAETSKVLIIENGSAERQLMAKHLSHAGFDVISATNMEAALHYSHRHQFDAIILDLFLADIDNCKIMRTLRSYSSRVSPLLVTAAFEQPYPMVRDFFVKPVDSVALLSAFEHYDIYAHQAKLILIIDKDSQFISEIYQQLIAFGFRVICKDNKVSALLALEQQHPDIIIVDPFIADLGGVEFFYYYRQTERGPLTPIIIWTSKPLSDEEYVRFKAPTQRIVLKGENMTQPILDELKLNVKTKE